VAICFGIDLEFKTFFRVGIQSDIRNLDAADNYRDDYEEYRNTYVICAILNSRLTHRFIGQSRREDSS